MRSKLVLSIIALSIAGIALFGTIKAYAQNTIGNQSTAASTIAQKFGLAENDVQSVFDEMRSEHQQEMKALFEQKLTQEVTDGKITEAQKQAILAKRQELEVWAKDQGIDLKYLFGGHRGLRGGWKQW